MQRRSAMRSIKVSDGGEGSTTVKSTSVTTSDTFTENSGTVRAYWNVFQTFSVDMANMHDPIFLGYVLFIVQILQLLSFSFESIIQRAVPSGYNFAQIILRPHLEGAAHYIVFWCIAAVPFCSFCLNLLIYILRFRGVQSVRLTRFTMMFSRVTFIFWIPVVCIGSCKIVEVFTADRTSLDVTNVVFILIVIVIALMCITKIILFGSKHVPSTSHFAVENARAQVLLVPAVVVMTIAHSIVEPLDPRATAGIILLVCATLAIAHLWCMPFYLYNTNCLVVAAYTVCVWSSFANLISSVVPPSGAIVLVIVFSVGIVPSIIGGWFLCVWRIWYAERALRTPISEDETSRDYGALYPTTGFSFGVCIRSTLGRVGIGKQPKHDVLDFISKGSNELADSLTVLVSSALYALEYQSNTDETSKIILQASVIPAFPDAKFMAACVSREIKNRNKFGKTRFNYEIEAQEVWRRMRQAVTTVSAFFHLIQAGAATSDGAELSRVYSVVSNVDACDRRAEKAMQSLIRRFPQERQTWSWFSFFCRQLRNDPQGAEEARIRADELEHSDSKKKTQELNHTKEKEKVQFYNVVSITALKPEDAFKIDGTETEQKQLSHDDTKSCADECGSQSSMPSSAGALARSSADAEMMRNVRKRIMTAKASSTKILTGLVLVTLGILYTSMVITYAVSQSTLDGFSELVALINSTASCQDDAQAGLLMLREYQQYIDEGASLSDIEYAREDIEMHSRRFEIEFDRMFQMSQLSRELVELWSAGIVNVSFYSPNSNATGTLPGSWTYRMMPLWDFGYMFINKLRDAKRNITLEDYPDLDSDPSFRFVLDNTPITLETHLASVSELLAIQSMADILIVQICLYITLPATFVICVSMYVFVFWRIAKRAANERRTALSMFGVVSPVAALAIQKNLDTASKSSDVEVSGVTSTRESSFIWFTNTRRLHVFYLFMLTIIIVLLAILFGDIMSFSTGNGRIAKTQMAAASRRNLCTRLLFISHEMIVKDHVTTPGEMAFQRFDELMVEFEHLDRQLKYCDPHHEIPCEHIQTFGDLIDLWYLRPCPPEVDIPNCYGVGVLMRHFVDELYTFRSSSTDFHTENNTHYRKAERIHAVLGEWLLEDTTEIEHTVIEARKSVDTVSSLVFWISLPLVLFAYPILKLCVDAVGKETERLFKLLIHVPTNIQRASPVISGFLEGDQNQNVSEVSKQATARNQAQTSSLLAASGDAIIVCDASKLITMFNAAAQKLTGYKEEEVVKKGHIQDFLPDNVGRNEDVIKQVFDEKGTVGDAELVEETEIASLKTKSEKIIQVQVSHSRSVVSNKAVYALFLRDMTTMLAHQVEITEKEEKSRKLLRRVLPVGIATEMERRNGIPPPAMRYEACTLLFADAVNFSRLAKEEDPEKVLLVLGELYGRWDTLCEDMGVEKIKTIGDCYMAATGVPKPTPYHGMIMMKFALRMLEILKLHNDAQKEEAYKLQFRIGMSSGPVVAGVIGTLRPLFDTWGDTVNVASRMEQYGMANQIQISEYTHALLKDQPDISFIPQGKKNLKNVGTFETYIVDLSKSSANVESDVLVSVGT